MTSPFAKIFIAIQARITSMVPEIKWIDFNLDQLNAFDGERPPVQFPCLLIDFNSTDFSQMQGYQEGDMIVGLTLAFDEYQQTNADTPEFVKEQALQYFEIEHKIHLALQAWNGGSLLVNSFIRTKASSETSKDDNFRRRPLLYKGTFVDSSVTG